MLVIVSQDLRIPLDRMAGAEDFTWHSVARDGPSQWSPSATVLCRWGQRQQQSSFSVSAEGPKLGSNAQEHDGTRHCLEKRRSNEQPRYWGCRCTVKNHDLRLLTVIWLYLMIWGRTCIYIPRESKRRQSIVFHERLNFGVTGRTLAPSGVSGGSNSSTIYSYITTLALIHMILTIRVWKWDDIDKTW